MAFKGKMTLLDIGKEMAYGCDVSYYQGDINFAVMKASGIQAVIIRAGYGTTTDKRFVSYINAAVREGLAVGVYWFIYAADTAKSMLNARKCLDVIRPYKEFITLGVWGDWEYDSDRLAGALSAEYRSKIVHTFNSKIETEGYEAGIYSNQDYIQSGKFQSWLVSQYPLWFARYSSSISSYAFEGKNGRPYMWQYSSTGVGKVHGVSSQNLDLNKVYVDIIPDAAVPPADMASRDPDAVKAADNPYPEPTRNILWKKDRPMMRGDDVRWVQWHLWRFGLLLTKKGIPDAGQIDGLWGAGSDRALEIAQTRLGLKQDRICGPISRETFKET